MEKRVVKVTNMVNKTVGVRLPEFGINRKWTRKGQTIPIDYDIVEQLLWHEGFRKMIDRGILYIENMQDKIDLGLEPEEATKPENIIVLNDLQIKILLTITSFEDFKKELSKLNATQINEIVNYAIMNELVDVTKVNYLKELTGCNILQSIARNQEVVQREKEQNSK